MMKRRIIESAVCAFAVLAAGCASSGAATSPAQGALPPAENGGNPGSYIGDPALYAILARTPLDSAAFAQLSDYEFQVGNAFADRLGDVAADPAASPAARINALTVIGTEAARSQFEAVRTALHARDPRVRAIALNTATQINSTDRLVLLREALDDSAPEIQAKALQFIGDDDVPLLREVVARKPGSLSSNIARDLILAAEEHGAPLTPDSATGVISRTSAAGYIVTYTPVSRWPEWDASAGHVLIRGPGDRTVQLPGLIEVVGNVVPVFFSPDGAYAVYESDRHIHVRDLKTNTDSDIGPGIAPRVRPVTDQFIYVQEDTEIREAHPEHTSATYGIMLRSFAPSQEPPHRIGTMTLDMKMDTHGAYSPARWMRIDEHDGAFFVVADGRDAFRLPSPFDGATP